MLTGVKKISGQLGYVLPCKIKDYEHMDVILGVNYQQLFYDPSKQTDLDMSLDTLRNHVEGTHIELGQGIVHGEQYPKFYPEIRDFLQSLHQYPELVCDIETFSLKFWEAGIGSIGFAWGKHNGGAFLCDYKEFIGVGEYDNQGHYRDNKAIKKLLREFFETYKGTLIYHNANFDVKVLIYELFMDDLLDNTGLINGLHTLGKNLDDTKIITYLATNSTAGNNLGLKYNAHEFAGNYAEDEINDIKRIKSSDLLRYNLVDCLCTHYVKEKNFPIMVQDQQEDIYRTIMLPSVTTILQMELTGMPLDMPEVCRVSNELQDIMNRATKKLFKFPTIKVYEQFIREAEFVSDNLLRLGKVRSKPRPYEFYEGTIEFNPASGPQLQELIYERMGYDVIDKTDTGLPATGAKTIKKLIHRSTCKEHTEIFETLIELSEVSKILGTFIKAFLEHSVLKSDGVWYLHGSFNLGGTVSGRLSSSKPNLQNIPAGSTYAKHIKRCFKGPPGWIMFGADFASLEDRISALTTKDPMKLKVYTDGYDGHCLRAFYYFGDRMPDIVDTVISINSIKELYPQHRQDSKAPTFALTYQGTWHTMVSNLGWSAEKSKAVEEAYHDLYTVSDDWVADKLRCASADGFITTAFGLRVRTPILAQTILGNSVTPYEAAAEGRTAGNALGQSYGLLNNRAANEFRERLLASEYVNDIKIFAMIHDAIYGVVRNNLGTIKWLNDNLPACMSWQELPEIAHDDVKLSGEVDLFYPDWSKAITLKNHATKLEILEKCK